MIKRVTQTINASYNEKKAVVNTLNNYINILTNPKNVEDILALNNNHILKSFTLLDDVANFISNNNTGTVVMKANTATLLDVQARFMVKPLMDPRILVDKDLYLPFKSLAEVQVLNQFAKIAFQLPEVKQMTMTGDKISFVGKSKNNVNSDVKLDFNLIFRALDVKSGNAPLDEPFKGNLREFAINNNEPIHYPNTSYDLKDLIMQTFRRLSSNSFLHQASKTMSPEDFFMLNQQINNIKNILGDKYFSYQTNDLIQPIFIKIMGLPTFHKALPITMVYHIQNENLSDDQMAFLNECIKYVPANIYKNDYNMREFLLQMLEIHRNNFPSQQITNKLLPYQKTYPYIGKWIYNMGSDVIEKITDTL